MRELITEVQWATKIYYDGRRNDAYCLRGTVYTGKLLANCKAGDKVVIIQGDTQYPGRIWAVEIFNKVLDKGEAGQEVALFFDYGQRNLPESKEVKIFLVD